METITFIIQFILGLILVVKGADFLTDGASSVARRFNVSTLIIGLTIVAFGTSLPELVVSTVSAIKGNNEIALGNVIGSNIFNTLAILGTTILVTPVICKRDLLRRDLPLNTAVTFLIILMMYFFDQNGSFALSKENMTLTRIEGGILLVIFITYIYITIANVLKSRRKKHDEININQEKSGDVTKKEMSILKSTILIILGLAMLIGGGDWFVDGASGIASILGVNQSVIALTIVAAGTSLPELVTSIMAARKGDTDMAIGNAVGSNIFNILLILGVSSLIRPMSPGNIQTIDFIALLGSVILLLVVCLLNANKKISKSWGVLFILCVIAYYTYLIMQTL